MPTKLNFEEKNVRQWTYSLSQVYMLYGPNQTLLSNQGYVWSKTSRRFLANFVLTAFAVTVTITDCQCNFKDIGWYLGDQVPSFQIIL